jgi:hypothetical protein
MHTQNRQISDCSSIHRRVQIVMIMCLTIMVQEKVFYLLVFPECVQAALSGNSIILVYGRLFRNDNIQVTLNVGNICATDLCQSIKRATFPDGTSQKDFILGRNPTLFWKLLHS